MGDTRVDLLIQELSRANIEKRLLLQELQEAREKLVLQERARADEISVLDITNGSYGYDRSRLYSQVHAGVASAKTPQMQAAMYHELQMVIKERDDLRQVACSRACFC